MNKRAPKTPQDLPRGDRNENPRGVSMSALLLEDLRTHDGELLAPGFIALAVHRFGNWRMDVKRPLRAPLTVAYRVLHRGVALALGIDLGYTVKVGRRVRIWHHGGMVLGARSIGDDVHIRQNTTFGVPSRREPAAKPVIGDRVDVGAGAVVLGDVVVGDDVVIGANTVVVKDVAAGAVVFGVPARPIDVRPVVVVDTARVEATSAPNNGVSASAHGTTIVGAQAAGATR